VKHGDNALSFYEPGAATAGEAPTD
jgi:hypothetical protein